MCSSDLTHIDFMRLHRNTRVNLFIHVTFENHEKAPGLKRGGTLTVVRAEVELEVMAGDIPDHITVDLTGREIGDSIHINDVVLPNGVKPTIDRNFVIANIAAPSGLRSSDNEEASAEAAAEEAARGPRSPTGNAVSDLAAARALPDAAAQRAALEREVRVRRGR